MKTTDLEYCVIYFATWGEAQIGSGLKDTWRPRVYEYKCYLTSIQVTLEQPGFVLVWFHLYVDFVFHKYRAVLQMYFLNNFFSSLLCHKNTEYNTQNTH